MRPTLAAAVLAGIVLLAGCGSEDTPGNAPATSPSPSAVAKGEFQQLAAPCPEFTGAKATAVKPGKPDRENIDNSFILNVQCAYGPLTGAAHRGTPRVSVNIAFYRVATSDGTPEKLAADNVAERKQQSLTELAAPNTTQPLSGLGDEAFAELLQGKGIRVYARSANVVVMAEYANGGDTLQNLATAQEYVTDVLAALRP